MLLGVGSLSQIFLTFVSELKDALKKDSLGCDAIVGVVLRDDSNESVGCF